MLGWLILAFLLMPLVELGLLIWIGNQIGLWPTVGLVIATGLLGGVLARFQGARALREVLGAVRAGRMPGLELAAGALFLVGAAFLLTPGVLTDVLGVLLMVPRVRRWTARYLIDRARSSDRVQVHTAGQIHQAGPAGGDPGPSRMGEPRGSAEEAFEEGVDVEIQGEDDG